MRKMVEFLFSLLEIERSKINLFPNDLQRHIGINFGDHIDI